MPHHLLGTVSPDMEFTAKDFRDFTVPVSTNSYLLLFSSFNFFCVPFENLIIILEDCVRESELIILRSYHVRIRIRILQSSINQTSGSVHIITYSIGKLQLLFSFVSC